MKCAACGYENEDSIHNCKWVSLQTVEDVSLGYGDGIYLEREYKYLYACPECGTVKIDV